jgi:hypothetical protein
MPKPPRKPPDVDAESAFSGARLILYPDTDALGDDDAWVAFNVVVPE